MNPDREKWNRRFASEEWFLGRNPSPFLAREIERIEELLTGRTALDIACGEGRNSLFLAARGWQVTALDISDVGLAKARDLGAQRGVAIDFRQADLEHHILEGCYDLVLNFNFLLRPLITHEMAVLAPGGILLFDTILESAELVQQHNPDYLLRRGEIYTLFDEYDGTVFFTEESAHGEMPTARAMFRKSSATNR